MSVAEKLTAIADAIRDKTESSDMLSLDGMAQEIPKVYDNGYWIGEQEGYNEGLSTGEEIGIEQGKKDAYDEFWDTFQQNGNRTFYMACFGSGWTPEIFKPKYPIKPEIAGYMFFNNMAKTMVIPDFVEFADNLAREQGKTPETHPDMFDKETGHYMLLDFSNCTNALYALPVLRSKHFGILDFSKCSNIAYLFYSHNDSSNSVSKIDKFVSSEVTGFENSTFQNAIHLTDITMSGVVAKSINFGVCPLNEASIRSVISVLSPTATGQTATFNKTAKEAAFTDEEWETLIATKSNWTISLV